MPTRQQAFGSTYFLEPHDAMQEEIPSDGSDSSRFRTTLIRVIIIQLVALGLLLLLQLRYQP